LKLPPFHGHDACLTRFRGYLSLTSGIVLAGLLALVVGTADGARKPKRVAFLVTLEAKVMKSWNAVTETTENGCTTSRRSVGRRTVTLRSRRPTTVRIAFRNGRVVSYAPPAARFVAAGVVQTGSRTTTVSGSCTPSTKRSPCARRRRAVRGVRFGFFRSARNEISFRRKRLPELPTGCPPESAEVREIQSGLEEAQGELSEADLANPRTPNQTTFGRAQVTTELEAQETGSVVEHVVWELTFTRKR
jgi:hypothetical protein